MIQHANVQDMLETFDGIDQDLIDRRERGGNGTVGQSSSSDRRDQAQQSLLNNCRRDKDGDEEFPITEEDAEKFLEVQFLGTESVRRRSFN